MFKRIFLFLAVNFVVVLSLSIVIQLLGISPYLRAHGLNIPSLAIFALVWGMGGAFISLLLSKPIAKWTMGVQILSPKSQDPLAALLLDDVAELSRRAGLNSVPEVGVFEDARMNAFATGPSAKNSLVAVSSGLLRNMSREQIKAVIGHEISHIANGDMVTMTLLQGVVNAFVIFLARILAFFASGMNRQGRQNSGGSWLSYSLFVFLFEFVFMILGSLVVAAFSRYREFKADAGSARIYSKEAMIDALARLKKEQLSQEEPKSVAALMISGNKPNFFLRFFASHPPLEERIRRLEQ